MNGKSQASGDRSPENEHGRDRKRPRLEPIFAPRNAEMPVTMGHILPSGYFLAAPAPSVLPATIGGTPLWRRSAADLQDESDAANKLSSSWQKLQKEETILSATIGDIPPWRRF
jgi:hypothetical protein